MFELRSKNMTRPVMFQGRLISVKNKFFTMMTQHFALIITATTTALIAGLLYAYSCSVNPGLGKLSDQVYIASMHSINREIQNPLFFISFIGTLLLLPITTWLQYKVSMSSAFFLLLIASLLYIAGVFAVTMLGNVPVNEALDKVNLQSASAEELANRRLQFEIRWNRLHTVRTIAAFISLLLVIVACVNQPNSASIK